MFSGCSSIEELNLSNFDTSQVKYITYMFCDCSSLKRLDISKFNTNNVIIDNYRDDNYNFLPYLLVTNTMFMGCSEELSKKSRDKIHDNNMRCHLF